MAAQNDDAAGRDHGAALARGAARAVAGGAGGAVAVWLAGHAATALAAELTLACTDEQQLEEELERARLARLSEQSATADFRRRSGPAHRGAQGSGFGEGTLAGLADAAAAVHVCGSGGCRALVDAGRARAGAARAGRQRQSAGDRCAGPGCAVHFRRPRFIAAQGRMAARLLDGTRRLAERPSEVGRADGRRRCDAAAARAAADALLDLARMLAADAARGGTRKRRRH